LDLGADGVSTQIADQMEAPSHSGVVSLDMDNYKIADSVVVTLDDQPTKVKFKGSFTCTTYSKQVSFNLFLEHKNYDRPGTSR
jgi:hypothetical protein